MRRIGGPLLVVCWMASVASAKTDRFVWTNSPAPAAPYTNWQTAAHVLQDAVDACESGDTVIVTNGVYDVGGRPAPLWVSTNRVRITNAIVVQSVNGAKATVLRGQGPHGAAAVRCAYLTNGATLSGFRLENGYTPNHPLAPGDEDPIGGGAILSADCRLIGCDVVSNAAATLGGGVYGFPGATVEACSFDENSAEDGGGAYLARGTLLDSTFRDNLADPGYGGGARVVDGDVAGCAFYRNNGYWGGGLMLEGGTASDLVAVSNMAAAGAGLAAAEARITGARLAYNTAYDHGGGAYLEMCWISDSAVSNNDLAWQELTNQLAYGAGIASTVSRIENCVVRGNRGFDADDRGGGIACAPIGAWTNLIIDCDVRGNSAGDGGGIFVQPTAACALSATGTNACVIAENTATNFGGGVCASTQTVFRALGDVRISGNAAGNGGGLALRAGSQAELEDSGGNAPVFAGNTATNSGGGFFVAESATRLVLRGIQIHDNAAQGDASFSGGGGLALYGGAELLGLNLVFTNNQSPHGYGGALLLHNSLAALTSTAPAAPARDAPLTQFIGNRATNQNGGAIYAYASQFSVINAAFFDNLARRGAAIHVDSGSTGRVGNVVFAGNVAGLVGGALRAYEATASGAVCDLRHCSLYGNAPDGVGRGGAAAVSLTNCISVGNGATNLSPGCTAAYCDVGGGYAGAGNVDADPGFRDPAARDFHLTIDSTGTVADAGVYAEVTNDCVLRARPLGAGHDMGAYEYRFDRDDSDGDGIPDGWESVRGLNPRDAADGPAHGDADGKTNFEEYLADTDPLDGTNYFYLTDCAYNPARPDRGIFVGFTSSSNRLYDLHSVPVVSNGCAWTAMVGKTDYQGVGSYDGFNDTHAPSNGVIRSYRVAVRPIPE